VLITDFNCLLSFDNTRLITDLQTINGMVGETAMPGKAESQVTLASRVGPEIR